MQFVKFEEYNPFKYNTKQKFEEFEDTKTILDHIQNGIEEIQHKIDFLESAKVDNSAFKELKKYIEQSFQAFRKRLQALQNNQNLAKANITVTGTDKGREDGNSPTISKREIVNDFEFIDSDSAAELNKKINEIMKKLENKVDSKEFSYITNEMFMANERIDTLFRIKLDKADIENIFKQSSDLKSKLKNISNLANDSNNINSINNDSSSNNIKNINKDNNKLIDNNKLKEVFDSMNSLQKELSEYIDQNKHNIKKLQNELNEKCHLSALEELE